MYRIIAIVAGALALAACSTSGWLNLDALKPKPPMETVRFESVPPGAQVQLPNGQTCLTPCAYPLESNGTYAVTYTLTGYQPASGTIAPVSMGDGTTQLRPNPVTVELAPVKPPPKKKVRHRRPVKKKMVKPARKPAPKKPAAAIAPPPPPAAAPPPQQAPSPWPPAQPPQH
jgi:PEGA domain